MDSTSPERPESLVLALKGPLGCGKTTASQYLVNKHGFVKISFADALKLEIFNAVWTGHYPQQVVDRFNVDKYPDPVDEFPSTRFIDIRDEAKIAWVNKHKIVLRELLQYWGTEYRRTQDENYWVRRWTEKVAEYQDSYIPVCTDDCRFPNEKAALKRLGGHVFFIDTPSESVEKFLLERDGAVNKGIVGHASEADNDPNDPAISAHITNNGSLDYLYCQLDLLLEVFKNQNVSYTAVQGR